jgi:hypothetical protein
MRDRSATSDRGERSGEGRICVTEDDRRVRLRSRDDLFERYEHARGLLGMTTSPDAQGVVRLRQAELIEKTAAMESSQCWPVSMRRFSCFARNSGRSAAALISCGRVPTIVTTLKRSAAPAQEEARSGR